MSKTLVLASSNPGKVREINQMLAGLHLSVVPQSDFKVIDAEETGLTFIENALLKARNATRHTGLPAIADDSGIEVDYLNGAPGIYSARYAGKNASDEQNLRKLLDDLVGIPEAERTARFQCLMVYLRHEFDPTPIICQGTWEGRILLEPRGANGFGYDPIFFVPELGVTSAELAPERKNEISHRGRAAREARKLLSQLGGSVAEQNA